MDSTFILRKSSQPAVLLKKGIITDCNAAFGRFFRKPKKELIGKKLSSHCPRRQKDGSYSSRRLEELSQENGLGEFCFKVKDLIITAEIHSIFEPKEEISLVFLNNIMDQEKVRSELDSFRSLVENSEDTIMRFDRSYRHLYVNQRWKSRQVFL